MRVCTVINKAWLAHARALAESLRAHEPDAQMTVLVVDSIAGFFEPEREPFAILQPQDLAIEDFAALSARYNAIELCCALKPSILRHLLRDGGSAVYLDSDVRVFAPLEDLHEALERHPFLLTPHLIDPIPDDGYQPGELAILLAGAFNLGFAAARATDEVDSLLDWWSQRLRTGSRIDPARGMVFDQRWADLMPGMFEHVGLCRDPGVNVGYWRAATSEFDRRDAQVTIDSTPLRTFHFTGFDPERPDRLSTYDNRTSLAREPVLAQMCADFARSLDTHGHATCRGWPYDFADTLSGAPMTAALRELWDRGHALGAITETPFTERGERAFLDWLSEPVSVGAGEPLSRYLTEIHGSDPALRERFPAPQGADRESYLAWAAEQAERQPTSVLGLLGEAQPGRPAGLRELAVEEPLGTRRGEAVVCIPVYGALELFAECLPSVLAHTPKDVRILIADDASPDPAIGDFVRSLEGVLEHEVSYLRQPQNLGFPGNVNAAFAAAAPADVVVLNSDCVVAAGWLEGLRRAAYSDALVATASALTNHGTILSAPDRNKPGPGIPQDQDLAHA
ncbi:MAG TPA: glycosyltransferase, partial [Solirubrobacteraceae bacterium]|nr:glycosyltransferase [Solirubrobacteraceae bacterium]